MTETQEYQVTLRFGSDEEAQSQSETTYEFATQAELDAFLEGVDAASGWMDYHIVEAADAAAGSA